MQNDVTRFAVAGDWHGNYAYARKALKYCAKHGVDVILHVGDLGVWPDDNFVNGISHEATRLNIELNFVDGNHEHHDWLDEQPIGDDGRRKLAENIYHLPRGFRWEWLGVTFLALGGACSVQNNRLEHINWFQQETLNVKDCYNAVDGGKVDCVIAHDAPANVLKLDEYLTGPKPDFIDPDMLYFADQHRKMIAKILDEVTPKYLWHGHYHYEYTDWYYNDERDCLVHGLDMDGGPFDKNIEIINTVDLHD